MNKHIVLIGDSILDNGSFTHGEPDISEVLRSKLPKDWHVTLLAEDGSLTGDVIKQVEQIPEDATHLIVSMGGNNAMLQVDVLSEPVKLVGEALIALTLAKEKFEQDYKTALEKIAQKNIPILICTIYEPDLLGDFKIQAAAALTHYNDVIIQTASTAGYPILDLRRICTEPEDFEVQIEPSAQGGKKIAIEIANALKDHDWSKKNSTLYP